MVSDGSPRQSPYELIGVSILGLPPFAATHYEWTNGFVTGYGKNGVGKSRFLSTVELLLRGESPEQGTAWLHIGPREVTSRSFLIRLLDESEWMSLFNRDWDALPDEPDWDQLERSTRSAIAQLAHSQLDAIVHFRGFDENGNIDPTVDRVADTLRSAMTGDVSLRPSGDGGVEVWAAARRHALEGVVAGELSQLLSESDDDAQWGANVLEEWFSRVPVPLIRLGTASPDVLPRVISAQRFGANEKTHELLLGPAGSLTKSDWFEVVDGEGEALLGSRPELVDFLSDLGAMASEMYDSLLIDAPLLRCRLLGPASWLEGQVVKWEAKDPSGRWVGLGSLSAAQRRWAEVSAQWVLSGDVPEPGFQRDSWPRVLLVDEPELALHPVAVDHLADGLRMHLRSLQPEASVIATTHSPGLLSIADRPLHFARDSDGASSIMSMRATTDLDLAVEELGIRRSDLLQRYRVFLVVEGAHDKAVLEELFGDEWEAIRTRILVMRGAKHALSVAASEVLLEFTDAHVVLLLDNLDHQLLTNLAQARALGMDGSVRRAIRLLDGLTTERILTGEEVVAVSVAKASLNTRPDRVHVHGLPRGDIIEYLPESAFGLKGQWRSLRKDYADVVEPGREWMSFKDWLRKARGASIGVGSIRDAARRLGHQPDDLLQVFQFCATLATR